LKKIKLEEGEVICSRCKGKCRDPHGVYYYCQKCNGKGKMDWVSDIMWVDSTEDYYLSISMSSTSSSVSSSSTTPFKNEFFVESTEPIVEDLEQNTKDKGG
jgi:hypothetical protein